jgi:hypothetical protein
MSILLNPVSIEVRDSFYPFCNTPATSLVDHVPVGRPATCLQLSSCDPRKILYTIYSEQNNGTLLCCSTNSGFPRSYDVTCCEEEAAALGNSSLTILTEARSIFLFTMLLDGPSDEQHRKLWSIFHDFYIHSSALDIIREQSTKLARLSENMESWTNGPYAKILSIVNNESLRKLHNIWQKYASVSPSYDTIESYFRKTAETVARKHYPSESEHEIVVPLTRSFGLSALSWKQVALAHMQDFWGAKASDI